ncbi:MAG: zinc-binding dehydrogenase, partial [Gammaproteobacteria bacterium]|nr:zinc-binding dehydrogenase [Gammaproteobacteria bacterium]
ICHSDITYIDGGWGGKLPKVFGHEAAGVVESVGRGVQSVARGDRVLVTLLRSCGRCGACESGRPHICGTRFALDREARMKNADGVTVKQGLRTGAFAEYTVVDASQVAPIPDDLPFDSASLLSCGVITGFGAVVNTAELPANAGAAVIGCGGVGLNAVQGAAWSGAFPLVAIDVVARKLQTARDFGATHAVNAAAEDVRQSVKKITAGRGMEYVFTAAGNPRVIEQGLSLLAPGGTLVIVGMPPTGDLVSFDATALADTGQRILSSKMGSTRLRVDIPRLVALHRNGRLKLEPLISNRHPLAEINRAIDEVRRDEVLRNVIVFPQ